MSKNFNAAYLAARKAVRVVKHGPGDYRAFHDGMKVMASANKRGAAQQLCAMRVAKQLLS